MENGVVDLPARREFEATIENAKTVIECILLNKFNDAIKLIGEFVPKKSIYHAITESHFATLQALFTYEQELIDVAIGKVKYATEVCATFRKKRTISESVSNWWVGGTNFVEFSEVELHAELCHAECLLAHAILTFIQDEHLIRFIEGGLRIRNAYHAYKYCMQAIKNGGVHLTNSTKGADFESGVYLGMGSFNILLSLTPPRIMRLLEWVGFHGDRKVGLEWLDRGFRTGGLRSPICSMALLGYHLVIHPLIGVGNINVHYASNIVQNELECYPDSSVFLYYSARLKLAQGMVEDAMSDYNRAASTPTDWPQVRHVTYWGMLWCHGYQGKWRLGAECAETLSRESKWSKCVCTYINAAFLIMELFELQRSEGGRSNANTDVRNALRERIETTLDNVKQHKKRIAGKSIPMENLAVARVDKYQSTGKLILPGLELIYIWNGFNVMSNHVDTLEYFLSLITLASEEPDSGMSPAEHQHKVTLCLLLKGACLRRLNRTKEAENALTFVASTKFPADCGEMDIYVAPYASAELGAMYTDKGDIERAIEQYEHTLANYSKYGQENRLHFRVHNRLYALKQMKVGETVKTTSSSTTSEEASEDEFFDANQEFQEDV